MTKHATTGRSIDLERIWVGMDHNGAVRLMLNRLNSAEVIVIGADGTEIGVREPCLYGRPFRVLLNSLLICRVSNMFNFDRSLALPAKPEQPPGLESRRLNRTF